jgi:hypothetical protein
MIVKPTKRPSWRVRVARSGPHRDLDRALGFAHQLKTSDVRPRALHCSAVACSFDTFAIR